MYGLEAENLEKYRSLLRNSLYSSTKEIFDWKIRSQQLHWTSLHPHGSEPWFSILIHPWILKLETTAASGWLAPTKTKSIHVLDGGKWRSRRGLCQASTAATHGDCQALTRAGLCWLACHESIYTRASARGPRRTRTKTPIASAPAPAPAPALPPAVFCSALLRSCSPQGSIDRYSCRVIDLSSIAPADLGWVHWRFAPLLRVLWGHTLGFLAEVFWGRIMGIVHSSGVSFHDLSRSASFRVLDAGWNFPFPPLCNGVFLARILLLFFSPAPAATLLVFFSFPQCGCFALLGPSEWKGMRKLLLFHGS